MKPLRIQIKNLGAIPSADIDLANITCAAIAGPNGAGKSTAFTIAPMFAMFGTTKPGTSADDSVRAGTSEMAVTFDFEHQGSVYRVIRTRSTKGKGKTTLELQRQSGELWTSESGASIAETQKKIIDLLGLDEETFSSSSMILQGQANAFTSRPAGQRKAILAQILQLEQYETLQEKAKARANGALISLETDKAMLAAIDVRLAERSSVETDLTFANAILEGKTKLEIAAEIDLTVGREDLAKIVSRQEKADQLLKQSKDLAEDLAQKSKALDQQTYRMKVAETCVEREPDILAKAAEHDRIREQVTVLQAKDSERKRLGSEGVQIAQELEQIEASLKKVMVEIGTTEQQLAEKPALELAVANLDDAKKWLASHELDKSRHDEETRKLAEVINAIANKDNLMEVESASKLSEIDTCKKRAAMLKDAQCIDIDRAECKFLADAKEAKAKTDSLQLAYIKWHTEALEALAGDVGLKDGIKLSIAAIDYDPHAHASARQQVEELSKIELKLKSLAGSAKLLAALNTQRADLETRQAALTEKRHKLRDDYKKLLDELAELPALNARLAELSPYLKQKEQLPAAREQLRSANEQIDALTAEINGLTKKIADTKKQYWEIVPGDGVLQGLQADMAEWQQNLEQIRRDKSAAILRIGSLQAKIDGFDKDAAEAETIRSRMNPLATELTRWQTLSKAFGRDGIPALIIENTVPELERIANEILGQMSGGKHSLRFETQRELKSRSGMAETLDIIVGDWAGDRIYETFSGGEQLRIDFAIRFALAELLARRAGARVDWLTIDEGFGSQSDEYLPLVLEAVQSVASRFGMVLVISHVKQVQEAFDQQIIFRPDGESVEVKVA